jgi:hypothetical protein
VLTFAVDHLVQRKQMATLGARAVPLKPRPSPVFDGVMTAYCVFVAALMLAYARGNAIPMDDVAERFGIELTSLRRWAEQALGGDA